MLNVMKYREMNRGTSTKLVVLWMKTYFISKTTLYKAFFLPIMYKSDETHILD